MPSRKGDPTDWVLKLAAPGNCSLGYSSNETINFDGTVSQDRDNEDRFLMCLHNDKQLFMVLDGHEGSKAVKFVHTHLPHILLKSDLSGDQTSIMRAISSAIVSTETEFFVSIDPYITRKVTLQIEIEQEVPDMNSSEAANLFPTQIAEIGRLDDLIKSGTTVVLALIIYNWLFVANVGDSRALLCLNQPGREGSLLVKQLSVDHNTKNEDELRRLEECGLNPSELKRNGRLGTQQNTRSIGDYSIKGGYHNVDLLKHATREPGTAEPYIHEPIDITGCQGFLILMSDGLYKAYEEWSGRPDLINEDLAHLVAKELKKCRGEDEAMVAQNVVDKVRHLFRESHKQSRMRGRLDDISLIVKRLGLSHSQSVIPSHQPYHSLGGGVPQTAPVTDKQFEFNGRQVSASLQPSHPPSSSYLPQQPYPQQYPPSSSYHLPPTSAHPSSLASSTSSYRPTMSESQRGRYSDTYDGERGREGGGGNHPYSGQQVPQGGAYPRQQGVQVEGGYQRWQGMREQYTDESGPGGDQQYFNSPRGNYPLSGDQGRGYMYPSASGQGPQSGLHGGQYGHQDPSGRFPQDRYVGPNPEGSYQLKDSHGGQGLSLSMSKPQESFGRGISMGQTYQGGSHQSRAQGSNYPPGGISQQSYQQDSPYQGSAGHGSISDDVATPVATPKGYYFSSRQQSSSSMTSDSSSSSDLTLMRPSSMAAVDEADTLREEDIATGHQGLVMARQAPHKERGEEGDPQTADSEEPHTQDSEGQHAYLPDDTEDEEEEEERNEGMDDRVDGDGCLKPYVKFGEKFPLDLSWFDIPLPSS